jgi:hypothetical protein
MFFQISQQMTSVNSPQLHTRPIRVCDDPLQKWRSTKTSATTTLSQEMAPYKITFLSLSYRNGRPIHINENGSITTTERLQKWPPNSYSRITKMAAQFISTRMISYYKNGRPLHIHTKDSPDTKMAAQFIFTRMNSKLQNWPPTTRRLPLQGVIIELTVTSTYKMAQTTTNFLQS